MRAPLALQAALADSNPVHDRLDIRAERLHVAAEVSHGGALHAPFPGVERARLTDADGRAQRGVGHAGGAAAFRQLIPHRGRNLDALLSEFGSRGMPRFDPPPVQCFGSRPAQPDLARGRGIGVQRPQQIQLRGRADRQRQAAWRDDTVADLQVAPFFSRMAPASCTKTLWLDVTRTERP